MANLITAQEVIELAFAENSNMREESIPQTTIGIAEIKYIRPAFGAMYALLADKYADFTNEYVKPALAYFVKCEMVSSIAIDMSNSGVAVANPQYQSAASDKQRQRLYDSEMGKAKTLLDYAIAYIAIHSEDFPDYSGPVTKKSYRVGGIVIGNERVATSIMGEAFKAEYERYLREMQEINEVVIDATEDVSKALLKTDEAIENVEKVTEEAIQNMENAKEAALTAATKATIAKENAEKVIEETAEAKENAEKAATGAEKATEDTRVALEEFNTQRNNYAQVDERYPKLTAGFADNLIGRGEATAEEFAYRASAGMGRSITDDTARVKKIKGNSVVWNQQCDFVNDSFYFGGYTVVKNNGIYTYSFENGAEGNVFFQLFRTISFNNHKWLAFADVKSDKEVTIKGMLSYGFIKDTKCHIYAFYDSYNNNDWGWGLVLKLSDMPTYVEVYNYQICDLTQMFGAGNEPTTIEDFYARIPSGIDIHAYNEGEIINLNTEAIKTVGFNQWDEQWERGQMDVSTGQMRPSVDSIGSKNFLRVIPNTTYHYKAPTSGHAHIYEYDKDYRFIGILWAKGNGNFTTSQNCEYIKFTCGSSYYPLYTYNNDICINLSHTGVEDGKYKPYTPFTRELSVIKKYFPNGMRSAGTAFDSIEWDSSRQKWVAVQRIGEVDLGSLKWSYGYGMFTGEGTNAAPGLNVLCTRYASGYNDKNIRAHSELDGYILVYDSSYSDPATFKASVQGVMLYYELAEPIVTEIEEENINFDYYVEDFGTEEALSSVSSAPFRADVVYTFNAVDTIRNNYLEIEELKKQMVQIQNTVSAMQTAQVTNEEV